ncbi:MAG: 30S ribosomal protein S12 methylthiotransferase RimO [Sphaerochaetaceae bacterium]|nr:30S ribosomal protein S12 methylthiotransferase RimO [Sphaerochaetaceae bacterium]
MSETKNRKLYIESLGCAKNQVDSEVIVENLRQDGWCLTEDISEADLVVVNTCGFIESAKQQSLDTVFQLRKQAPENARFIIGGCLAQRYPDDLFESIPEADGVFGNRDLGQIASFADKVMKQGKRSELVPQYPEDLHAEFDQRSKLLGWPGSAYLKISEGCNHRCHYCAIPVIRGDLRSRPEDLILADAKALVDRGIKEINVIAQDLAAYGMDSTPGGRFLELLEKIADIPGDFRIRLLYIHPDIFPMGLLDLMKRQPKILHYFDIPMQHANARVLKAMGRTGNPEIYYNLISKIREALPDAVIRTTLMLGFLEEDDEAFEELCAFVRRCRFDWMGSFTYSREEDTPAYSLRTEEEQKKMEPIARRRQKKLEKIQERITSEQLQKFVGNQYEVLIEEKFKDEDLAIGRIYSQAPDVDGQTVVMGTGLIPGQLCRCGIRKVAGVDLDAVKIDD